MMEALILILWLIAGVLFAEQETLYKKYARAWFPKAPWWISNNWKYENPIVQWLMRYPLARFKDGEHFVKGLGLDALAASVIIAAALPFWYEGMLAWLVLQIAYGVGFNASFHDWV